MALTRDTAGVYAVAPTPFHVDGRIDERSLDRLVDFYDEAGVDGLTVLGQLGEAAKLEESEARAVALRVLRRAAVPVVVGVSAPGFATMRSLAATVMDAGAAGVMIAPPPGLRSDEQVAAFVADAVHAVGADTPFVLQDYPLVLDVRMAPTLIARIATENPSCVVLKHEDWPGLDKISALRALEAAGRMPRLSLLCGNGGLFLDFETDRGADGAMTGYCFPETLVRVVRLGRAGERDAAHDLFDAHLPLIRYEQQPGVGLAVRKYVLRKRGLLGSDTQRRPSSPLSLAAREEVDYLLDRVAVRDQRSAR